MWQSCAKCVNKGYVGLKYYLLRSVDIALPLGRSTFVIRSVLLAVTLVRINKPLFKKNKCDIYGDRGSTVVKVLGYKSESRWFDPSWCHWIFH